MTQELTIRHNKTTWHNHVIEHYVKVTKVKNNARKKVVITPTMQAHVKKFLDECQRLGKIQRSRQQQSSANKEDTKRR